MIFSAFVTPAKAATAEELQKMINDLMAQMAALQGGSTTGSSAAGVCPYTWTRDLKTGATGADVQMLQKFLNANADTRVAATGAGSAGMETTTFGPATAAAVSKFQVMHRADILTPAGLTNPTGFFGSINTC
jgi:peptidoglycan hydrolase-like protein with peptidoglycan-binding domain